MNKDSKSGKGSRIPLSRPSMSELEGRMVEEVLNTGWLGEGEYTSRFEEAICTLTGSSHAIAVNTGTSALHLSLLAMGVGSGDEVILPSLTFASDPMAVLMCGAKPVFCDIDPETLNLDASKIPELLTERTKAIMPTDYAGVPCDTETMKIAVGESEVRIIRDASHSFGARRGERYLGIEDHEDAVCFSFDPIKNLTCGEGGAVLTNENTVADSLRIKKGLGIERGAWLEYSAEKMNDQVVTSMGYRYHMSNVNAAIGLAQLERLREMTDKKQRIARLYDALLADIKEVSVFKRNYDNVVPFLYPVRVDRRCRNDLMRHLNEKGILASLRYYPCHLQPLFETGEKSLTVTENIAEELLCLPIYCDLSFNEVRSIAACIQQYLRN